MRRPPSGVWAWPFRLILRLVFEALDLIGRVFRYDYFISYSRRDGAEYARRLKAVLEPRGLRCRIDKENFYPGQSLPATTIANLARSSALICVITPGALDSWHVADEVDAFSRHERPIIPIDIKRAYEAAGVDTRWHRRLGPFIRLEDDSDIEPSADVVDELLRSVAWVRYRTRVTIAVTTTVLLVVLGTVYLHFALAIPQMVPLGSSTNPAQPDSPVDLALGPEVYTASVATNGTIALGTTHGDVFCIAEGRTTPPLRGVGSIISDIRFLKGGEEVVAVSSASEVATCWGTKDGSTRWSVKNKPGVHFTNLSPGPDRTQLLLGDTRGFLWTVREGVVETKLPLVHDGREDWVESIEVLAGVPEALVCLQEGGPGLVDPRKGPLRSVRPDNYRGHYNGAWRIGRSRIAIVVDVSRQAGEQTIYDRRSLAVGGVDGKGFRTLESRIEYYTKIYRIGESDLFLCHDRSGKVAVWNARTCREVAYFTPHPLHPDRMFAFGYDDVSRLMCVVTPEAVETWSLRWQSPSGFAIRRPEWWK